MDPFRPAVSPPAVRLVTIDCGNSTIDCLDHAAGQRLSLPYHAAAASAVAAALRAFLQQAAPRRIALVAVAPAPLALTLPVCAAAGLRLRQAGSELPCPLPLDYATPATLGADRWVGALAAHREFGRAVVVDCGTATTVNLVEADGRFRGGAIAPGIPALEAGLRATAPALPQPQRDALLASPPRSSQAAVDTGLLLGYCGLVERLVSAMLHAAAGPAQVVLTGGCAGYYARYGRLQAASRPELVHQGLRLLDEGLPCND